MTDIQQTLDFLQGTINSRIRHLEHELATEKYSHSLRRAIKPDEMSKTKHKKIKLIKERLQKVKGHKMNLIKIKELCQ